MTTARAAQASRDAMADLLHDLFDRLAQTDFSQLGVFAVIGLLLSVWALLSRVEDVMNDAWTVHRARAFGRKLADYVNLLIVMILIFVSLSVTALRQFYQFSGRFGL